MTIETKLAESPRTTSEYPGFYWPGIHVHEWKCERCGQKTPAQFRNASLYRMWMLDHQRDCLSTKVDLCAD